METKTTHDPLKTDPARCELSEAEIERLETTVRERSASVEPADLYWIGPERWDDGEDYCRPCAVVELIRNVARYRRLPKREKRKAGFPELDGGWPRESDGQRFCSTCNRLLEVSYTNYACESELEHYLANGFGIDCPEDWHSLHEMASARGWEFNPSIYQRDFDRSEVMRYFEGLWELGRRILAQMDAEGR